MLRSLRCCDPIAPGHGLNSGILAGSARRPQQRNKVTLRLGHRDAALGDRAILLQTVTPKGSPMAENHQAKKL